MPVLVSGSPSFQGHARPPASGWRHRTARADSGFFCGGTVRVVSGARPHLHPLNLLFYPGELHFSPVHLSGGGSDLKLALFATCRSFGVKDDPCQNANQQSNISKMPVCTVCIVGISVQVTSAPLCKKSRGWGGIRTHGTFRFSGFQDRRIRPLYHPSRY